MPLRNPDPPDPIHLFDRVVTVTSYVATASSGAFPAETNVQTQANTPCSIQAATSDEALEQQALTDRRTFDAYFPLQVANLLAAASRVTDGSDVYQCTGAAVRQGTSAVLRVTLERIE